jgi:hypothetical protein
VALDFGIAFRRDADTTPLVRLGRQRHQGGPVDGLEELAAAGGELAHQAALNSSTRRTAASTLAMSLGLRGRVRKTVVP